jgi:hypothetical protein
MNNAQNDEGLHKKPVFAELYNDEGILLWRTKTGDIIPINKMETSHLAFALRLLYASKWAPEKIVHIQSMLRELECRTDMTDQAFTAFAQVVLEMENEKMSDKIYNIRIQSSFILTPRFIKEKLGIGFKIIETEVEKDVKVSDIKTVEDAVDDALRIGFRALARAHHPDLGGDSEKMVIINRAKKEMEELLKLVRNGE